MPAITAGGTRQAQPLDGVCSALRIAREVGDRDHDYDPGRPAHEELLREDARHAEGDEPCDVASRQLPLARSIDADPCQKRGPRPGGTRPALADRVRLPDGDRGGHVEDPPQDRERVREAPVGHRASKGDEHRGQQRGDGRQMKEERCTCVAILGVGEVAADDLDRSEEARRAVQSVEVQRLGEVDEQELCVIGEENSAGNQRPGERREPEHRYRDPRDAGRDQAVAARSIDSLSPRNAVANGADGSLTGTGSRGQPGEHTRCGGSADRRPLRIAGVPVTLNAARPMPTRTTHDQSDCQTS